MNPNDVNQNGGAPNPSSPQDHQSAAANVIRSQIDALYGGNPVAEPAAPVTPATLAPQPAEQPQAHQAQQQQASPYTEAHTAHPYRRPYAQLRTQAQGHTPQAQQEEQNPYQRTHAEHPQPQAEQWKAYHSAWQNYYQKYYEAFYAHQRAQHSQQEPAAHQGQQAVAGEAPASNTTQQGYFSDQTDLAATTEELTKDQALFELRQKLLGNVRQRAKKIRGSRHFIPIASALAVVLVFVFLQYNRVLIASVNAYVSPGSIDPQNIVVEPTGTATVSEDPRLIIPKINVDVPVVYGVGYDHDSQMKAMEKGVAHFAIPGANSHPGEVGNTVLSGHSSNDLFDRGDYKFIFAQLEKLKTGDTIYANYEGKRYTYVVTKKEVVKPTQVSKLVYATDKPIMTLITCTPLGTSRDRLLVTAEQISPDPSQATAAPQGSGQTSEEDEAALPGNSPTLLERLFGAR